MVSWFVKQGLVHLAQDLGDKAPEPKTRDEWGRLAQRLGVKGVHIAERDTQRAKSRSRATSSSTPGRSKASYRRGSAGGTRLGYPREMGAGQRGLPQGRLGAAIFINQPGADTRVRSWTPTARAQFGFLVTHNESISIADYYTVRDDKGEAVYRPTCHYAYHPCDDAVLSLHEFFGRAGETQTPTIFLAKRRFLTASTNSACSLRARPQRLLVGSSSRSRRRARSRHTRTRPECRSHRRCSRGWSGRWKIRGPASSRPTNSTSAAVLGPNALSRACCRRLYRLDAACGSPWPLS